jgi:plasmid maintenance system antidote protein VapI
MTPQKAICMSTPDTDLTTESEPLSTEPLVQARHMAVIETLGGLLSARQIEPEALAAQLGWRTARLKRLLAGKDPVSTITLARITAALGVDFELVIRDSSAQTQATPAADTHPWQAAGLFIGMTTGIALLAYVLGPLLAADTLPPLLYALLGAALFVLARSHWKLHLARRELRALKRYLRTRRDAE